MSPHQRLGQREFEIACGLPAGSLDERTKALLEKTPLLYTALDEAAQAAARAKVAEDIDRGFTVVGEHRASIWRDAWQDHLDDFISSGHALEALNPRFVGGTVLLRWQGAYVEGVTERLELAFLEIFRDWLFRTYLADTSHLYEFGSGSAFNVAAYAKLYPQTDITALDWAPAAVTIANLLGERHGMKIAGERFDFFAPDSGFEFAPNSSVLTMCALEQVGERFRPFLDFILEKRPKRVVHVEPMLELYDPALPHDALAIRYHQQRKYLTGLLPHLRSLEQAGSIRLLKVQRLKFGSRFHECFSLVAWEPV
ncbi:hypothetical protein [Reyranella sp.]|uniref:hypothetical protein n=1 Tax=Reyranella sp. TaxID=1929291 RepID=UPI003C7D082B